MRAIAMSAILLVGCGGDFVRPIHPSPEDDPICDDACRGDQADAAATDVPDGYVCPFTDLCD